MKKSVDLIIFDLDGTLIDSQKDIVNAVNIALVKLGLKEKDAGKIVSYIGTGLEDLLRKSLGPGNEALLKKAITIFDEFYKVHHSDNSRLYPGVKKALDFFKDKKKAVITNRNAHYSRLALEKMDILGYFNEIMGGDESLCRKPDSCQIDRLITRFKIDKKRAIIVGDMDIDIKAGKKAGILTCGVTYGIGEKQRIIEAKPDYIIDDICKLEEIIN